MISVTYLQAYFIIAGRAGFPVWRRQQQSITVNNSQQQSVTSGFGLVSLSAGGGGSPRVAIWVVGFRLCRLLRLWIGDFRGRRGSARVRPGRRLWIGDFRGRRGPARARPSRRIWIGDFPRPAAVARRGPAQFSLGFQWSRTNLYRISVVPHKFL